MRGARERPRNGRRPSVEDILHDLRAPGEADAQRRAWEVAAAALEERRERPGEQAARSGHGFAPRRRFALAAAGVAGAVAIAVTPAGGWVGDRVRDVVKDDPPARASGLDELPGGGRVLVLADGAPWIAGDGGHHRLLGAVDVATWSPRGRFLAIGRESELFAVDPQGRRRWSVATPGPVHDVAWSPDGFRVAYTAGRELRVVAGDGTGDRRVAAMRPGERNGFGALAWRPGSGHVLAFVKRRSLFLADLDARRVVWRRTVERRGEGAPLAFSSDGERLLISDAGEVTILAAANGRAVARVAGDRAAWAPDGRRIALVRQGAVLFGEPGHLRRLFAARDVRLAGFSPDGRWLLVDWRDAGSWLFLPTNGGRPRQLAGVASRFGARDVRPLAWCC